MNTLTGIILICIALYLLKPINKPYWLKPVLQLSCVIWILRKVHKEEDPNIWTGTVDITKECKNESKYDRKR